MSALENERELRDAYETVTMVYHLRDRVEAEPTGDPESRKEEAISIEIMIRKIERQIAAYLASREEAVGAPLVKAG